MVCTVCRWCILCRTPGHPENFHTPGVEVSTGPLGQGASQFGSVQRFTNAELVVTLHIWVDNVAGISNAVGMAIAQSHIAANFNVAGEEPVSDHFTYVICGKLPR